MNQTEGLLLAGRYRLGESIGRGGMGRVWRARDEVLHRTVAIKELTAAHHVQEADRAVLFTRTQTEARAAARINHPAVVTVHDVLEYDERPWIVMELVEGGSLADAIREAGRVEPREAARIGLWTLRALRAAHAAGVLHRDVKPGNVLLANDGRVLLTDFGIAQVEGDSAVTRTGEIVGSVEYLAPERISGAEPGPASDLWALGATLYTAVEGISPFRRPSPIGTLQAVVTEEPEPLECAGALGPVIVALLRKDPAARPGAEETEQLLAEAAEGRRPAAAQAYVPTWTYPTPPVETPAAPRGSAPAVPAAPARKRRRPAVIAALVAAALLGGGIAGGARYLTDRDPGVRAGEESPAEQRGTPDPPQEAPDPSGAAESPSPRAGGIPEDWERVTDPLGFSLMLPRGWERRANGSQIDYTPDGGEHFVRIGIDTATDWENPYLHQLDLEKTVSRHPDYQRVRLEPETFRDQQGARWEFTWTAGSEDVSSGPRRAVSQSYIDDEGTEYVIYMSSPAADWADTRRQFESVLRGWAP